MNNKKKLNKAIKSARESNEMASYLLGSAKISSDEYIKVIFGYVSIILEHHRSIIELTNVRQLSALTLLRPLYESYIRIMWLTSCVSEKTKKAVIQLVHDVEDGNFPTLRVMCEDIDKIKNRTASEEYINAFARDLEHNKRIFHSFTHSGAQLIAVASNHHFRYTYKEMISMLETSSSYMATAMHACVAISGNLALAEEVWELIVAQK